MAHLNPGASISLPDCLDMEGCQLVIPHAAVLDRTEEETPDGKETPREDASTEAFPKPNDSEEIVEENEMEDKTEEVKIVGEVKVNK